MVLFIQSAVTWNIFSLLGLDEMYWKFTQLWLKRKSLIERKRSARMNIQGQIKKKHRLPTVLKGNNNSFGQCTEGINALHHAVNDLPQSI